MIAEYENDVLKRRFIYGPGIDEPIMMINAVSGARYYYHYDGLGSVVALSNSSGTLVESYRYNVFGIGVPYNSSDVGNPYMFTGARCDLETDLYYMRARYYNPWLGRFLSPDPIGYADSMNLYQYCLNNPINFTDPWGLATVHYWSPSPVWNGWALKGSWGIMYGHVSMTLDNGTHISWWPDDIGKVDSLQGDNGFEGREPDVSIKVSELNENAIENWWNNYSGHFSSMGNNCSNIVGEALRQGGMNVATGPLSTPGGILNAVSPPPYIVVPSPYGPPIYIPNP